MCIRDSLKRDVKRHQRAGDQTRVAIGALRVADQQHGQHEAEGDCRFGNEGHDRTLLAGKRRDEVHRRMRQHRRVKKQCRDRHSGDSADELKNDVEQRVPGLDLAEPEEGQRHRRVEVGPRALAPRRVDEGDGGEPHGDADEDATQ